MPKVDFETLHRVQTDTLPRRWPGVKLDYRLCHSFRRLYIAPVLEIERSVPSKNVLLSFAFLICWLLTLTAIADAQPGRADRPLSKEKVRQTIGRLKKLDKKLADTLPGEWLESHKEKGQRFAKYASIRPNMLTVRRHTLYIQPIGTFSETETKLTKQTAAYLEAYFNCTVKTLPAIDADTIPDSARRVHPQWGDEQLQTTYILEQILEPKLPDDAFATIAFTNKDLWPGNDWNYVFGYAAYFDRVGVWSLYRFGDPEEDEASYKKCLWRMIKLSTHETGHMFSMQHCIHAQCNMQGSNHLQESDKQPLHLCSQCHAKTVYATSVMPIKRLEKLKKLCEKHGFEKEVEYYKAAIKQLEK